MRRFISLTSVMLIALAFSSLSIIVLQQPTVLEATEGDTAVTVTSIAEQAVAPHALNLQSPAMTAMEATRLEGDTVTVTSIAEQEAVLGAELGRPGTCGLSLFERDPPTVAYQYGGKRIRKTG